MYTATLLSFAAASFIFGFYGFSIARLEPSWLWLLVGLMCPVFLVLAAIEIQGGGP